MKKTLEIIKVNIVIALVYFFYLILLDLAFVLILEEQKTLLNDFVLLIVTMPFISGLITLISLKNWRSLGDRLLVLSVVFIVMSSLAYLEMMWVAIHFHSMIGGHI